MTAQSRALALEKEIYAALLVAIGASCAALRETSQAIATLDCLCAFAQTAKLSGYTCPDFTDDLGITIQAGVHPLCVDAFQQGRFVANDTCLRQAQRIHIITGPNMGGKSTYMRQCAALVLLAHIGCYVPAAVLRCHLVDQIFCRVGSGDDMATGRSTFMVEMTETANILHNATQKSLVLMDEVGRGTSTYDGMALAWAIVEHLREANQSMVLFATHYFELTALQALHTEIANWHLQAQESAGRLVFLYRLAQGATSKSYGLQVAKLAGLPAVCLQRAKRKLQEFSLSQQSGVQPSLLLEPEDEEDWQAHYEHLANDLRALDLDHLSPREALDVLYHLTQKLHAGVPA